MQAKENKQEGPTENLLGPDNNTEFLKHIMNILKKCIIAFEKSFFLVPMNI